MLQPVNLFRTQLRVPVLLSVLAIATVVGMATLVGCSGDSGTGDPASSSGTGDVDQPSPPGNGDSTTRPGDASGEHKSPASRDDQPAVGQVRTGEALPSLETDFRPTLPEVVMSVGHQKTCLVDVGDTMPTLTLPNTGGEESSLADLSGPKLTVVLFWTLNHPYAREQFERLGREVVEPYGEHGVSAVTINVGDPRELVQAATADIDTSFAVLLDAEGTALSRVATKKLPRSYLLDPSGRILWFDIEYSEGTRRELNNAILWHLLEEPAVATR